MPYANQTAPKYRYNGLYGLLYYYAQWHPHIS